MQKRLNDPNRLSIGKRNVNKGVISTTYIINLRFQADSSVDPPENRVTGLNLIK